MSGAQASRYPVLGKMLDRLHATLFSGPQLNCRPHRSRQRIDITTLTRFNGGSAERVLTELLGEIGSVRVDAKVPAPPGFDKQALARWRTPGQQEKSADSGPEPADLRAYRQQLSLINKLRKLGDDARTYQQDTGIHGLEVGFPIVSLPPGSMGAQTRRILAPIALVGVRLEVRASGRAGVTLTCRSGDIDRVVPNVALMAWLERETGEPIPEDLFVDEEGAAPWREIAELIALVAERLDISLGDVEPFTDPDRLTLETTPRADALPRQATVLPSAVLGLFPSSSQSLLRDMRQMIDGPVLEGPVRSFVEPGLSLDSASESSSPGAEDTRCFGDEACVMQADPFQARAVRLARRHAGLVIHGPPGTGKSQTITNIIGDHLARGQRVLFVCDKRTALDVVANRLRSLGLESLCAVVHDPQRDQRPLYMAIRGVLEELSSTSEPAGSRDALARIDAELQTIHAELDGLARALHDEGIDGASGASFHQLVARWLAIESAAMPEAMLPDLTVDQLDEQRRTIEVTVDRALAIGAPDHPWMRAVGMTLDAYLSRSGDAVRQGLGAAVAAAEEVDTSAEEPMPPFHPEEAFASQLARRETLLDHLRQLEAAGIFGVGDGVGGGAGGGAESGRRARELAQHVATASAETLRDLSERVAAARTWREALSTPLDTELAMSAAADPPSGPPAVTELARQASVLERYLASAQRWQGFLAFGAKRAARSVLGVYGLPLAAPSADRLNTFVSGLRSRLLLTHLCGGLMPGASPPNPQAESGGPWRDETLRALLNLSDHLLSAMALADEDEPLAGAVRRAVVDQDMMQRLTRGLERSPARVQALVALEEALVASELFDPAWSTALLKTMRDGTIVAATEKITEASDADACTRPTAAGVLIDLQNRSEDLETVLRIRTALDEMPPAIRVAVRHLIDQSTTAQAAWASLEKHVIRGLLRAHLGSAPNLARLDPEAVEHALERFATLQDEKRSVARDLVSATWAGRQRARLLAGTRTRLNSLGASMRQRLLVRGRRSMRLRKVLAVGRQSRYNDDGGDPIYDLCPVWLCSPETVAQIFPREPIFDVVIFDEASQCRLEEALPVLLRGKRVVIAGDPKQLPPTRFFEAALATSDDVEVETDDDLFEQQQSEVEDLLTAALNLDVQESYLDVHYRSRSAALIQFSNEHFYSGRLQAIPGHPKRRERMPPISFRRADGIYQDRVNPIEAEQIVCLVETLLLPEESASQSEMGEAVMGEAVMDGETLETPSIGIACFNLAQRDLIVDLLDARALDSPSFSRRLDDARSLRRGDSFEGLFVKNLENVQGDERDHIIVSTTYGPNAEGRFYRRFGPLGRAGGGRRLNVLVTRARHRVHLVTSIPPSAFREASLLEPGKEPTGSWLLFAYLRHAEWLERAYAEQETLRAQAAIRQADFPQADISPANISLADISQNGDARAREVAGDDDEATDLADALGRLLAVHSDVEIEKRWGNEGFGLDVVVSTAPPTSDLAEAAPVVVDHLGLHCDFARFDKAPDGVEWDIFRRAILGGQDWALQRLWTPLLFRDPDAAIRGAIRRLEEMRRASSG